MSITQNPKTDRARCLIDRMFQDKYPVTGLLVLDLYGPDGELKDHREMENTITVLHDATVADRMAGGTDALIDNTGIGTTSGGKSTASTTLEAEVARVVNDSDTQGAGAADNDVVHIATFGAGVGTGAIIEAGLFTDPNPGATLMAYQEFAAVNKAAGDSLVTTWTVTYGAS